MITGMHPGVAVGRADHTHVQAAQDVAAHIEGAGEQRSHFLPAP